MPFLARPLLLTTLLTGCQSDQDFTQVWNVNPLNKPADVFMSRCLPPDESACLLDASGNIDTSCVDSTRALREEFKTEITNYLLPADVSYDDFISARAPMTVQAVNAYDDSFGLNAADVYTSGGFAFSYGDHRGEGDPVSELREDSFYYMGFAEYPRWNCFADQDSASGANPEVWGSIFPANDALGNGNDLWWEIEAESGSYFFKSGHHYLTSDGGAACSIANPLCQTAARRVVAISDGIIDAAFVAAVTPYPDQGTGVIKMSTDYYYNGVQP